MSDNSLAQSPQDFQTDVINKQLFAHLWRGGKYSYWWEKAKYPRSVWFAIDAASKVQANEGTNVYFGVHPVNEIPPTNAKGEKKPVAAIRSQIDYIAAVNCLFAEFDAKDYGGGLADCEVHIEQLYPQPSVIVFSGGGYHCYWLLDTPYVITSEAKRKRAIRIQKSWVQYVNGDSGSQDLARLLRVPGTVNYKGEYAPDFPKVDYRRADFSALFDIDDLENIAVENVPQNAYKARTVNTAHDTSGDTRIYDAYAMAALENELDAMGRATEGQRNCQLNRSAFALGQFVAAGALDEHEVTHKLLAVAKSCGLSDHEAESTFNSGFSAGMKKPRRLPERTSGGNSTGGNGGNSTGGRTIEQFHGELAGRRAYVRSAAFSALMRDTYAQPRQSKSGNEYLDYRTGATDEKVYNALLTIADIRGAMGWAYHAGLAQIRDKAGLGGKSTVQKALARLVGVGLVEIVIDGEAENSLAPKYFIPDPVTDRTGGSSNLVLGSTPVLSVTGSNKGEGENGLSPNEFIPDPVTDRTGGSNNLVLGSTPVLSVTGSNKGADSYVLNFASDPFLTGRSRAAKLRGNTEKGLGDVILVCIAAIESWGPLERSQIVARTGRSKSSIMRATQRGESLGLLASTRGRRGAKIYELPEIDVWESIDLLKPNLTTYKLRAERQERDDQHSQFFLERALKDTTADNEALQATQKRLSKLKGRRRRNLAKIHPQWTEAAIDMWINAPKQSSRWHMVARLDAQERNEALTVAVKSLLHQGIDRADWANMLSYAGFDDRDLMRGMQMAADLAPLAGPGAQNDNAAAQVSMF